MKVIGEMRMGYGCLDCLLLLYLIASAVAAAPLEEGTASVRNPGAGPDVNAGAEHIVSCSWSPTGRWLAFVVGSDRMGTGEPIYSIYAHRVGTSQPPTRLTHASRQSVVTWHPERDVLAVMSGGAEASGATLWLLTPDRPATRPLATLGVVPIGPAAWQPTARSIAFIARRGNREASPQLVIIDATTGQ